MLPLQLQLDILTHIIMVELGSREQESILSASIVFLNNRLDNYNVMFFLSEGLLTYLYVTTAIATKHRKRIDTERIEYVDRFFCE